MVRVIVMAIVTLVMVMMVALLMVIEAVLLMLLLIMMMTRMILLSIHNTIFYSNRYFTSLPQTTGRLLLRGVYSPNLCL